MQTLLQMVMRKWTKAPQNLLAGEIVIELDIELDNGAMRAHSVSKQGAHHA